MIALVIISHYHQAILLRNYQSEQVEAHTSICDEQVASTKLNFFKIFR